MKLYCFSLFS